MANLGTFSGLAKLVLTDTGGTRSHIVTTDIATNPEAAMVNKAFELAAGATLAIHYRVANGGVPTSAAPTAARVDVLEASSATIVQTFTVAAPGTNETFSFTATSKAGTYRLRVQIQRVGAPGALDYLVNSDNTSTLLATGQTNDWGAGFLRAGTTIASLSFSDAALGGAAPSANRFVYPKSQFFRTTFGHQVLAQTRTITLSQRQAGVERSTDNATTGTANPGVLDVTRTGGVGAASGVNNAFLAADTGTVARLRFDNSSLSSQPWTHLTALPSGWSGVAGTLGTGTVQADAPSSTYSIDPRVTFSQLMQFDSVTFMTPPTSGDGGSTRLSSQFAQVAARARDAAGAGINGLAWTEKLWDAGQLTGSEASPTRTRATVSTTQGGEVGWSDAFLGWSDQLPGGAWTQKQIITTANATGLDLSNTRTLTLQGSPSPTLQLRVYATAALTGGHFRPGTNVIVSANLVNFVLGSTVAPDAGSVFCILTRMVPGPTAGQYKRQYLVSDTDNTGSAWVDFPTPSSPAVAYLLSPSADDAALFTRTFSATAGWGSPGLGLRANARCTLAGSAYAAYTSKEVLGPFWSHTSEEPLATRMREIWQRLGLDPANPLLVTPEAFRVPASGSVLTLAVTTTPGSVTVTRTP